jgi:hypothetical protein
MKLLTTFSARPDSQTNIVNKGFCMEIIIGGWGQKVYSLYGTREDERRKTSNWGVGPLSIQMLHEVLCEQPPSPYKLTEVVSEHQQNQKVKLEK